MSLFRIHVLGCVLALAACSAPLPPPAAPEPEPEPELEVEEVALEPPPEIPVEERIRAPFAVQSSGRIAPRQPRADIVVLDAPPARPPAAARPDQPAATLDTAGATNGQVEADRPAPAAPADPPRTQAERPPTAATSPPRPERPAATAAATPPATSPPATPRPASPAAQPGGGGRQHVVQSGETFYAIARRYEVTSSALAAVNPGIDANVLRTGQVLRLPAYATTPQAARPAAAAPAAATPRPTTPSAGAGQRTHRVVAGETLWGIARRYGVSAERIRTANRMTDDVVRIGQTLVIPSS